ncbi:MAG: RnfABCDGE type electron transport complex subunit B [Bacillota bacterium]|jgi:electron transport complex protein RnfB|nr:RnfABCDGE type electron transport complex subunit B [Bacillota bacterium]
MMALIDINSILWAMGLMLTLGFVFALILLIASIKLRVEADPTVQQIHEALPKIDCGACGFAGCGSYAEAVAADPKLIGRCAPGGADAANRIAAILNLEISAGGAAQYPVVHCSAHTGDKRYHGDYQGIRSCISANALPHVQACAFGCLGFGDCTRACKFDALHIIDGLATVDYDKCTGCTACSKACPRNLIEMVPFTQDPMLVVACSNKENGKTTRQVCDVGCIACGICKKQTDLFAIDNNLSRMDYARYAPGEATETARTKCPTKVIVFRGKKAPAEEVVQDAQAAGVGV